MIDENFYRAFEDRHRGTREAIKSRLRVYLPFIRPLLTFNSECKVADLGCGRGEWLELMAEAGFEAHGVDLDEGMLEACRERGLSASKEDAFTYLQSLSDESLSIVSGFHIAEHLSADYLHNLVRESFRVLKPGGLLIMETPNAENLIVGANNFYMDPTHKRPIPPLSLSFLMEFYGFARVKILRLQESSELANREKVQMMDVIAGVSPDYAVVAQKRDIVEHMSLFDAAFAKEYGMTQEVLASRYERRISVLERHLLDQERHLSDGEIRLSDQERCLSEGERRLSDQERCLSEGERRLSDLERRLSDLEREHQTICNSCSWRITAPLRAAVDHLRIFFEKIFP